MSRHVDGFVIPIQKRSVAEYARIARMRRSGGIRGSRASIRSTMPFDARMAGFIQQFIAVFRALRRAPMHGITAVTILGLAKPHRPRVRPVVVVETLPER